MVPSGSNFELGASTLSSEAVKKGWNAFSTLNNAIDGVRKVASDVVGYNGGTTRGNENYKREPGNNKRASILEKIEVGQVYGRLKNDLKLIQIFEKETKSMGNLEIVSLNSNIDFSNLTVRWRRKIGEKLVDIQGKDSSLIYNLTADDVGTIIIIEIYPNGEANDSLNITYGELGPIEIDDTTKISLSKSLKTGLIRFPVQIIRDEFESLINADNNPRELRNNENSLMTKDILVVTNDDVKVVRNGMTSSNSGFEKRVEWSAKYFGGNIHIQLNHHSSFCQEFTLCSGYDTHKQKISVKATSRNARDIAALTIRCLNIRHSISLEAIIGGGVSWTAENSTLHNSDKTEIDENRKLNIFAYIGRLEDEIANLENGKERLSEDKKRIQTEKSVLENELAETIAAYQNIISQYQQEKDAKTNINLFSPSHSSRNSAAKQNKEINIEFGLENKQEAKHFNYSPNKKSIGANPNNPNSSSLLHGYSGTYPSNNSKQGGAGNSGNSNNSHHSDSIPQNLAEINKLLEENASLKLSISQLNTKFENEVGARTRVEAGSKESMERMHAEIEELRGRLEKSDKEKEEFRRLCEKLDGEMFIKIRELESIKSGQDLSQARDLEKMQQLQDRILELQSQNSEKQQAIQTLSTEKSKLLKDFTSLKLDFDKLKEQHNQLNKKYISLSLENSRIHDQEKSPELGSEPVKTNSQDKNDQTTDILKLKNELEEYKKTNTELNQTITQLKSRVRRLAMINST
ncbi:putative coiled coil [Cryptosporidium sp. chipmunk genotype I]|uniref:putative coiled coil n=1 Tax=Cryptosporidium sp. chipmunk genotype I TaxID=1280935 RepID=UPI00351A0144|nr:putative coiled coil [Cryptosporidium sp. chipmunk genotype I]